MRNARSPQRRVQQPVEPMRKSKVQQAPAQVQDINTIVNRHLGVPGRSLASIGDPAATRKPQFIDLPSESYHDMMNKVASIDLAFGSLGSRLRSRFKNDPYQLLRWVEVPENRLEAISLGLITPTLEDHEAMAAAQRAKAAKLKGSTADAEQLDLEQQAAAAGTKADPEANPTYATRVGGMK